MTASDILKLTDPKNQNLPVISPDASYKSYDFLYVPVFEEDAKKMVKDFSFLKPLKVTGKSKESFDVVEGKQLVRVRGMGKKSEMTARKYRRMFGSMYMSAEGSKAKKIGILCEPEHLDWAALAIHVAALNPSIYKPSYKKEKVPNVGLINKQFKSKSAAAKKAIARGTNLAAGKNLMRVLGATSPNALSTEVYADVIKGLCKRWGIKCKHLSGAAIKKYELLNAVSEGSGHRSQLVVITLGPKTKSCDVLVGKGLCYDSGGVQGKGNYMKSMKEDMAGSASLLGTIQTILKNKLKLKKTTHFLMPLAENMMGSSAMRADDVWTAGDGQTVEIIHTDAEGRLVMGDAICYAKNNFKNIDRVLTIATLTGSCIVALGEVYTGVVCNDDKLAREVTEISRDTGDLCHVAPWDLEYDDNNSPVADVANLGEKDRDAGWIKGGFYLSRFVPKDKKTGKHTSKFCHFDIAGSIDMKGSGSAWRKKGFNSGVGVTLLSHLLTK